MRINSFYGENRWLSNFWPCPVVYEGLTYNSTESAYKAAKVADVSKRVDIQRALSSTAAKHISDNLLPRSDWDNIRVDVMLDVNRQKFLNNKDLYEKLIATGDAHLEEGNTHNDTFWGTCNGVGENQLGKILMKIRKELQDTKFIYIYESPVLDIENFKSLVKNMKLEIHLDGKLFSNFESVDADYFIENHRLKDIDGWISSK